MKNVVLMLVLTLISFGAFAQTKKTPGKAVTTKKGVAKSVNTPSMKNALDSFSYALGLSIANFYKEQGVKDINNTLVVKALNDVKKGTPLLDETTTNNCIVNYMQISKGAKAAGNKKLGQAFLDSNKNTTGVVTLPSGLQYKVIKEGTGAKPVSTDKVKVHYEGPLIGGKIFDSSIQRGEPLEISVSGVIQGWTEALQLMPVGSKWKLFIPSDLGYGDNGAGGEIKPGETLIFDVELIEIVK
jgi:FKBP-type peptidyl-prolyl cis-trans isomerase FklB